MYKKWMHNKHVTRTTWRCLHHFHASFSTSKGDDCVVDPMGLAKEAHIGAATVGIVLLQVPAYYLLPDGHAATSSQSAHTSNTPFQLYLVYIWRPCICQS